MQKKIKLGSSIFVYLIIYKDDSRLQDVSQKRLHITEPIGVQGERNSQN